MHRLLKNKKNITFIENVGDTVPGILYALAHSIPTRNL